MDQTQEIDYFIALERSIWEALKKGDVAADELLLSDDFRGVYSDGIFDKSAHVAQLRDGPTVSWYELTDPRVMRLAENVVALSYLARWRRVTPRGASESESMYVTSIWRHEHGTWANVFSQDTRCEAGEREATEPGGESEKCTAPTGAGGC